MRDSVDADLGLKEKLKVEQELHEFKIGLIFIRLSPTTLWCVMSIDDARQLESLQWLLTIVSI